MNAAFIIPENEAKKLVSRRVELSGKMENAKAEFGEMYYEYK